MSWNEERIELLRQLWDKGISASQIAEQLGNGITRNAVIGKAHRLNLKSRPSPVKPDAAKKAAAAAKAAAQAAPVPPVVEDKPAQEVLGTGAKAAKASALQKSAVSAAPKPSAAQIAPALKLVPEGGQPLADIRANEPTPTDTQQDPSNTAEVAETPALVAPPPAKRAKANTTKTPHVTLLDLTDKICKWPIGHPSDEDFHFCGKPVNPGTPYCAEHCAVAYQAQLPRRDKRPGALPVPKFRV
jgi:GcrA cell cycle regulator